MKVTLEVEVPDRLAEELPTRGAELNNIFTLGIEQWRQGGRAQYSWLAEVLEKLAQLPTPQEVLAMRPSAELTRRIDELLEKNRTVGLSAAEQSWWKQFAYVEHLVRIAKARALLNLQAQ